MEQGNEIHNHLKPWNSLRAEVFQIAVDFLEFPPISDVSGRLPKTNRAPHLVKREGPVFRMVGDEGFEPCNNMRMSWEYSGMLSVAFLEAQVPVDCVGPVVQV